MVRILKHGEELENFLDAKLDRSRPKEMTTPSFILKDSDFALNPPPGMARSSPTIGSAGKRMRTRIKSWK